MEETEETPIDDGLSVDMDKWDVYEDEKTPTEHVEELVPTWNLEWIDSMLNE